MYRGQQTDSVYVRAEDEQRFTACSRHRHRERHVQRLRGRKDLDTQKSLKGCLCSGSKSEGRLWFKVRVQWQTRLLHGKYLSEKPLKDKKAESGMI